MDPWYRAATPCLGNGYQVPEVVERERSVGVSRWAPVRGSRTVQAQIVSLPSHSSTKPEPTLGCRASGRADGGWRAPDPCPPPPRSPGGSPALAAPTLPLRPDHVRSTKPAVDLGRRAFDDRSAALTSLPGQGGARAHGRTRQGEHQRPVLPLPLAVMGNGSHAFIGTRLRAPKGNPPCGRSGLPPRRPSA